jgi:hypothetical protein
MGTAKKGTLDILWPGGTRNRLDDVRAGERLTLPEIPCSYAADWPNLGQYVSCVAHSLSSLRKQGLISEEFAERLQASAIRAYKDVN